MGFGSIGRRHFRNLRTLYPEIEIAVLRSGLGETDEENYIPLESLQSAIDFQPDFALICSPAPFHIDVALQLVEAGVHLFIEKPLSDNVENLDELKRISSRNSVTVALGYNLRFTHALQVLHRTVTERRYGSVYSVSAEVGQYLPDWRPQQDYRKTVSARKELGGGALLELSHELDYLCWMLGEPVRVIGHVDKVSPLEIDVEDTADCIIEFGQGAKRIVALVHLDFLQRARRRECRVICEEATVVWDGIANTVLAFTHDNVEALYDEPVDANDSYIAELTSFLACIQNKTEPAVSVTEGMEVVRLIEAIKTSAVQGRRVAL